MDSKKRYELVTKGIVEIVTEKDLKEALKKKNPVVYHGFEPSGTVFHIGYLIGINKHIDFQKAGLKLKILLADFHAFLNGKGDLERIRKVAQLYEAGFAALGVDMKKAELILGSSFQLKPEYFTDVMKLSLRTRLLRAKRTMTMIAREEKDPQVAQMLYPLMQAADIKALNVDIAFGDLAQRKVHMLAREELPRLNFKAPVALHHELMVGLQGGNMSSSVVGTAIKIDESPEDIKKKISKAFCPAKQPKDNPILQICEHIIFPRAGKLKIIRDKKYGGNLEFKDYIKLESAYSKGLHPSDLKTAVAESLIKILEPVRKRFSTPKIKKLKKELS